MAHREDAPGVQTSLTESARTLTPWSHEWRTCTHITHREKWVRGTGRPERLASGETAWVMVILDISDRKRTEAERLRTEQIRHSQRQLRQVLDSAIAGIIRLRFYPDSSIQYDYISPHCEEHFGYRAEELTPDATLWQSRIHPEDWTAVFLPTFEAITQQRTTSTHVLEYRFRRKDEAICWILAKCFVKWHDAEQCWYVTVVDTDISDRKQAEISLQTKTEELDQFFSLALDLLCIANVDGHFIRLNHQWEKTLGYPLEELEGARFFDYVHPDDLDVTGEAVEYQKAGGEILGLVNRYRCQDGSYRWIEWRSTSRGNLLYAAARDITDRIQADEKIRQYAAQLETSNRELEAFAYSVSHDLRAPLRAINGFSKALLEDYEALFDAEARDYFDRICKNVLRMGTLIDDLLSLSRVARSEICYVEVDLSALVEELIAELVASQPDRQVEVAIAPDVTVHADATLMRIVLMNLLHNAWKFTSVRSIARIEFGVTVENEQRVYFVKDNGAGFDMAYVDKLFGVFQRLHTIHEFPGTGIGLATVQRIIQRHGGSVWAEAALDEGATFYFSIL